MPEKTPLAAGEQPPEGVLTVPEVFGRNVRVCRLMEHAEQEDVAKRMRQLGHRSWRGTTVSEIERGRRNTTVTEMIALVLILGVSVEQLLDGRGPLGPHRGPRPLGEFEGPPVALPAGPAPPDEDPEPGLENWLSIPASAMTGIICSHRLATNLAWSRAGLEVIEFVEPEDAR